MSIEDDIQTIKELRSGHIPESIVEEHKILSEQDATARQFAGHMQSLWARLVGATNKEGYDPQKHQARFLLSASDSVNAFIFSEGTPPIIVFTKGLMKVLETEGEMAGVLMHEKLHRILKERLGLHPNSYMEESGADVYGAYALRKAGFPPQEMASALAKLPDEGIKSVLETAVQIFADPHPPMPDRIRAVEDATSLMDRYYGPSDTKPTAINPAFTSAMAGVEYTSDYMRRFAAITEAGIAPAEQLNRATAFISELDRLPDNEWGKKQVEKFIRKWRDIKLDPTRPDDAVAFKVFAQRFLEKPRRLGDAPGAFEKYFENNKYQPDDFGELEPLVRGTNFERAKLAGLPVVELQDAAKAMVGAQSREAFLENATKISKILDGYNTNARAFHFKISGALDPFSSANYALPEVDSHQIETLNNAIRAAGDNPKALRSVVAEHGIPVPWHAHVQWAQQAMEQGDPAPMKALHYLGMGAIDPRVTTFDEAPAYKNHRAHHELINPEMGVIQGRIDDRSVQKLPRGGYGKAIDIPKEQARLANLDLQQRAAVATADWGLLARDFNGFTWQYRRFLSPVGTEISETAPFVQRFIEESGKLLAADREKYVPLLRQFLGIPDAVIAELKDAQARLGSKDLLEYASATKDAKRAEAEFSIPANSLRHRRAIAFNDKELEIVEHPNFLINPEHPYSVFVAADPYGVFSVPEKVNFLSRANGRLTSSATTPEKIYDVAMPQSIDALRDIMKIVKDNQFNDDWYARLASNYFRFNYLMSHPDTHYSREEFELFTDKYYGGDIAFEMGVPTEWKVKSAIEALNARLCTYEISSQAPLEETIKGFRYLATYDKNSYFKEHPEIRVQYETKIAAGLNTLKANDPHEANRLTKMLLYSEIKEPGALFTGSVESTKTIDFLNARFKQDIIRAYVASEAAILGTDSHTSEYTQRAKTVIDAIAARTSGDVRHDVLRQLTDAVVSGREVSYYARDKLLEVTNTQITEMDIAVRGGTLATHLLSEEAPDTQQAFLKFLQHESTPEKIDAFLYVLEGRDKDEALVKREVDLRQEIAQKQEELERLNEAMKRTQEARDSLKRPTTVYSDEFIAWDKAGKPAPRPPNLEIYTPEYAEYEATSERLRKESSAQTDKSYELQEEIRRREFIIEYEIPEERRVRKHVPEEIWNKLIYGDEYRSGPPVTEEQKRLFLQVQHDNFWAMSTEARTLYLSRQLFPTTMENDEVDAHFQEQKNRILREQLPDSMNNGADARIIAEKYIGRVPREEARLLLSALIASRDPRIAHDASLGDAIGLLAKAMGSAENKLAQVGHSYEATPEDIRAGLEHSKSDYKRPARWTAHDWVSDYGPPAAASAHVGGVLGSGSYNVTIPLEYEDGRKTALNILRPHVEESAAYGFSILEDTAQALVAEDGKYRPLLDLVQQTRRQLPDETNTQLAAGQASAAHQNYHGTVVKTGGYEFHITTADWISHGERYKETLIAPGVHFNDLPESTPEDLAFKKAAAKALFTTELSQWSQGHATDADRHGKQQKILHDPNNSRVALITMFDHGMQKLQAPSLKTQMLVGATIENALVRSKNDGIEFSQALAAIIDEKVKPFSNIEPPEEIQHLSSLKRGLLQMSDYVQYMDKSDISEAVAAIRKSGRVSIGLGLGVLRERVNSEGITGIFPKFGAQETQPDAEKKIVLSHDTKLVEQTKVRLNPSYAALITPSASPRQMQNPQQQQQRRPEPTQAQREQQTRWQAEATVHQAQSMAGSVGRTIPVSSIESPEFYDLGRIIDPNSPTGVAFAERMQALTERLASNRYDPTRHRARYLLADDQTTNAYTIPSSEPPVIVIHSGLLKDVQSLDELAGVLAHEWGHILARQELGEHRNSKAEEGGADVLAVRLLTEAGFNAKALENLLLRMEKDSPPSSRLMQAMFDVHPLADNRASTMEKARILLNRSGFTTDNPSTALPEEFKTFAREANYVSTIDIPARLHAGGYENKPLPEKLEILVNLAQETAQASKHLIQSHYTKQIFTAFKEISVAAASEEAREVYHSAFSKLMHTSLWAGNDINKFYEAGLKGLGFEHHQPWEPIGDFRELKAASSEFFLAETRDAAVTSAERLSQAYAVYKENGSIDGKYGDTKKRNAFLRKIALGELTYPSVQDVEGALARGERVYLPLARHEQWAKELAQQNLSGLDGKIIDEAVMLLRGNGAPDGIFKSLGLGMLSSNGHMGQYRSYFEIENEEIKAIWPEPVEPPPYKDDLAHYIEAKGGFASISIGKALPTETPKPFALEAAVIAHHVEWQHSLLQGEVRWDLLEKNPRQFYRIYEKALRPMVTAQPYEHPFAQALIHYMQEAAVSRPEWMTYERRYEILNMLPPPMDVLGVHDIDKVTTGIDQDHPYIREYLAHVDAGYREFGTIPEVAAARINPYAPIDTLKLPLSLDTEGVREARAIEEIRNNLSQFIDKGSYEDSFQHYLEQYSLIDRTPGREYQDVRSSMEAATLLRVNESTAALLKNGELGSIIKLYDVERGPTDNIEGLGSRFQEHIISSIGAMENAADRHVYINKFVTTQLKLAGPKLRNQLGELIAEDVFSRVGKDDGSPEYQAKALKLLERYCGTPNDTRTRVDGALRTTVIAKFAEYTEAQPAFTAQLQRYHHLATARGAIKDALLEGVSEVVFEKLKEDPVRRAGLLNYLMQPVTAASRNTALEILGGDFFDFGVEKIGRQQVLEKFHAEYWNLPLVARMAVTNDLIFTPGSSPETAHLITNRMLDRLMGNEMNNPIIADDLLGMKDQQARKLKEIDKAYDDYFIKSENIDIIEGVKRAWKSQIQAQVTKLTFLAQTSLSTLSSGVGQVTNLVGRDTSPQATARLIVDAYLDTVAARDPKEAQLLVSALMSAEHERAPGMPLRLGQTLHQVLSHMGPAGTKLLQAIHSNPNTPQDIRDDLKYSKIKHDLPLRWDAIDLARDAGLLDPTKTSHVGPVVAGGSFGITMFNTAPDGVTYADTLLRPRADAIAEREFSFMLKATQIIANADDRMVPVLDMVREGQYSARIETQMSLAAKQNQIIEQVMDGVQVKVRGEDGVERSTIHNVARLVEFGERYKRAEIAQGEHFLSLPESVPMEERRATVLSMAMMQLTQRMAGMPMDRDRHGGNIKVDGGNINHFDFGMTEVVLATDMQKQALGMVVAQAAKDTARGGEFVDHLLTRISKADVSAEARGFLAGFNREILALGDYFNALPTGAASTNELTGILGHALYGEHTDPVIRAAYEHELGAVGRGKAETVFRAAMAESSVTISHVPRAADLQMPTLAPEERAIVENRDYGLPQRLTTQRNAIQSGANNGIGVAMGAYGLWNKFNDKDGTFYEDMKSGDVVRQALAVQGVVMDVANIGAGAVSTAADAKTFQQAKVKAPAATAPVTTINTSPTAPATAPTSAGAPPANAAPAPQAQGGTNTGSAVQQAEKAAAEALKDGARAAQELSQAGEKLLKAGKIAGKVAIPLAVATGTVDASAGARAGDRERVAGAVGGTAGGILGGMAVGMAAGAATGAIWGSAVPGVGTIVVGVVAGLVGGVAGAIAGEEAAKHWASGLMGRIIGSDDKFLEALKQLDPATQKQFAKAGAKLTLNDVHEILKSGKMDSVDHVDANKDGKLTGTELKAALEKARTVFIDNKLTEQLSALEAKGWGKALGNKDGKLTLDELKTSLKEKGIDLATLIHDEKITGKAITDALTATKAASTMATGSASIIVPPRVPVTTQAANPQARG